MVVAEAMFLAHPQPPRAGAGGIHIDSDGRGSGRGYGYEVLYQGAFAPATVKLQAEQSINAEAGAMSGNVELQSQMKGGLMGALMVFEKLAQPPLQSRSDF